MMIRDLNNLIFKDLIDRFKWYQKPFKLDIFCIDKKTADIFEKEIDKQELLLDKIRRENLVMYRNKL